MQEIWRLSKNPRVLKVKLTFGIEWSDGYGVRFGVTYTDYNTLERTPKKSALLLKQILGERLQALEEQSAEEHAKGKPGDT